MIEAYPWKAGLLLVVTAGALFSDLKWRKIPNCLTGGAILAGLAAAAGSGGLPALAEGAAGLFVGTGLLLVPFLAGAVGGGDVKFLAAVGSLMGSAFVLTAGLYACVAGGAVALALLVRRRTALQVARRLWTFLLLLLCFRDPRVAFGDDPGGRFPFAVALAAGVAGAYFMPLF